MTNSSRKAEISRGVGRSSRTNSGRSPNSSSMMSLQRSMHSSQMYTPGPAMSFLTCFCDLPQKEHLTSSLDSQNFAMLAPSVLLGYAGGHRHTGKLAGRYHFVNDAVLLSFRRAHNEVPVRVRGHLLGGLARVQGDHLVEQVTHPDDLLGLDLDVCRLTGGSTIGLVEQDPGVGQGVALALCASSEDHRGR